MFQINSKTCTKFSKYFLIGSVFLLAWLMIIWFSRSLYADVAVVYYLSCLLSGISFIFATGTHSKILKRLTEVVHFSSIYVLSLYIIGLLLWENPTVLLAIVAYLLLSIWILKVYEQKWVVITCLGIPMILSTVFFIKLNYELIIYGERLGWDALGYTVILNISGLIGLTLSTILNNGKVKWILLGINYFFAAYYHILIFLY
ncbi:hypothetical protein P7H50_08965 [Enterococcus durans]|uniref:hypothetical protein n=1 Tax=Enterococcus durans TaxID=53345 RepID=UPI0028905024|nr:hypothetical protein [Enterococcus durans]MDT2837015.1 hypothetical protein [Enterococcus durans]